MNAWSDVPGGMRGSALDEDTIERLLSARIAPDDAPPGYADVARLIRRVAGPSGPPDLALEERHVAAAIALLRPEAASTAPAGRPQPRSWRRRARFGGLVLIGALVGSSGLAFAGSLPDPAQDAFANVFERVGITVPVGRDAPPSTEHPASTGEEISDVATSTDASGVDRGAEISSLASGGRSHAGQAGGPPGTTGSGEAPPVETPNAGGAQAANAASGSASEAGTDRAEEQSGGRSAVGSANASGAADRSSAGSPPEPRGP